jgi:hypothetical protein
MKVWKQQACPRASHAVKQAVSRRREVDDSLAIAKRTDVWSATVGVAAFSNRSSLTRPARPKLSC